MAGHTQEWIVICIWMKLAGSKPALSTKKKWKSKAVEAKIW